MSSKFLRLFGIRVRSSIGWARHPMFCGSKKKYKKLGWSYKYEGKKDKS